MIKTEQWKNFGRNIISKNEISPCALFGNFFIAKMNEKKTFNLIILKMPKKPSVAQKNIDPEIQNIAIDVLFKPFFSI